MLFGRGFPSLHAQKLLLEAAMVLLAVRLLLTFRQTSRLNARIARLQRQGAVPDRRWHDLREIAWSVRVASVLVPGATCLTQAVAGAWLLARRGRNGEVHLTLPASPAFDGTALRPHAWLFCGETIVLGGTPEDFAAHRLFARPSDRTQLPQGLFSVGEPPE